jgi:hypothetical protein
MYRRAYPRPSTILLPDPMRKEVVEMLESVVGFLAKVAFWAFLVGIGCGIYLGVRYWPQPAAEGGGVSCVAPGPGAGAPGPSG